MFLSLQFIYLYAQELEDSPCGPGLAKCLDRETYIICYAGRLVGPKRTCPRGKICVNNNDLVCENIIQDIDYADMVTIDEIPEDSPVPYCTLDVDYNYTMPRCNQIFQDSNLTIPGTGCRRFFHCSEKEVGVYECPDNYFFDGIKCSNSFVCPYPCNLIPEGNKLESIVKSNMAMFSTGVGRWPVNGTNCKLYTEWTTDDYGHMKGKSQRCPVWSWFDPHQLRCRMRYLCEDTPNSVVNCPGT